MSHSVIDLDYPAVSVASPSRLLGAYFDVSGNSDFYRSVQEGVDELTALVNNGVKRCPNSQWFLAGYSQGAMVVSSSLAKIPSQNVLYVALLGDPNTYLPEGGAFWSPACRSRKRSEYRVWAPECRTREGVLGARNPYVAEGYAGKLGLWCNKDDAICGSSRNLLRNVGHLNYSEGVGPILMHYKMFRELHAYWSIRHRPGMDIVTRSLPYSTAKPWDAQKEIFALLPYEEYSVKLGEELLFDASNSFSLRHFTLSYYWSFDDGKTWEMSNSQMPHRFNELGEHEVLLKVFDGRDFSDVTTARVLAYEKESDLAQGLTYPAPGFSLKKTSDDSVLLELSDEARSELDKMGLSYVLLALDGNLVGYFDASEANFELKNFKSSTVRTVALALMDADFNFGDFARVELREDELVPDLEGVVEEDKLVEDATANDVNGANDTNGAGVIRADSVPAQKKDSIASEGKKNKDFSSSLGLSAPKKEFERIKYGSLGEQEKAAPNDNSIKVDSPKKKRSLLLSLFAILLLFGVAILAWGLRRL